MGPQFFFLSLHVKLCAYFYLCVRCQSIFPEMMQKLLYCICVLSIFVVQNHIEALHLDRILFWLNALAMLIWLHHWQLHYLRTIMSFIICRKLTICCKRRPRTPWSLQTPKNPRNFSEKDLWCINLSNIFISLFSGWLNSRYSFTHFAISSPHINRNDIIVALVTKFFTQHQCKWLKKLICTITTSCQRFV